MRQYLQIIIMRVIRFNNQLNKIANHQSLVICD